MGIAVFDEAKKISLQAIEARQAFFIFIFLVPISNPQALK